LIKYKSSPKTYLLSDKYINFAISATIALPMVDTLINVIANIQYWDSVVTLGIYYFSMIIALYYSAKRIKIRWLWIPAVLLTLALFSLTLFPENGKYLADQFFLPFFSTGLPLYIITLGLKNSEHLYKSLRISSIVSIISAFIFVILQSRGEYNIEYMSFSYGVTLPVMLILIFAFEEKNILNFIFGFVGIIIILLVGARGPMVGIITGAFFYYMIKFKINAKNVALLCLILGSISILLLNFDSVLNSLNDFLVSKNLSSRTIELITKNQIEQTSGRNSLYHIAFLNIPNLIVGTGMMGDRVLLKGAYVHNFFLEIWLEYGLILGSIFISILIYYLTRSLFSAKKGILYFLFFSLFFTTGFMKLQFSFSYTLEPTFYMMLALIIKMNTKSSSRIISSKREEKYAKEAI
jgi:hypothetical protein